MGQPDLDSSSQTPMGLTEVLFLGGSSLCQVDKNDHHSTHVKLDPGSILHGCFGTHFFSGL